MSKRLASLALSLVILGSVYAGMPLHSSEECGMPEMAAMDCCKKAVQAETISSEDLIARLCCALNCSQPGTTGSQVQPPRPSTIEAVTLHPSPYRPQVGTTVGSLSNFSHSPPTYSSPPYILHVALLI